MWRKQSQHNLESRKRRSHRRMAKAAIRKSIVIDEIKRYLHGVAKQAERHFARGMWLNVIHRREAFLEAKCVIKAIAAASVIYGAAATNRRRWKYQ